MKIFKHKESKPKRDEHERDTQTHAGCLPKGNISVYYIFNSVVKVVHVHTDPKLTPTAPGSCFVFSHDSGTLLVFT